MMVSSWCFFLSSRKQRLRNCLLLPLTVLITLLLTSQCSTRSTEKTHGQRLGSDNFHSHDLHIDHHPRPASSLQWHPCQHGVASEQIPHQECATINVPLNYKSPEKDFIPLEISRHQANQPTHRIGVLFVSLVDLDNAQQYLTAEQYLTQKQLPFAIFHEPSTLSTEQSKRISQDFTLLREYFDIISFPLRGSTGSSHEPDNAQTSEIKCTKNPVPFPHIIYPATVDQFQAVRNYNHGLGLACAAATGPLINHVDTRTVVEDVNTIRTLLHESTISFYGISHGSEIGQLYAEKYPETLRAIVLDGNVNHSEYGWTLLRRQALTQEDALKYFDSLCHTSSSCTLPDKKFIASYANLILAAQRGIISTQSGEIITPQQIIHQLTGYLYLADPQLLFTELTSIINQDPRTLASLSSFTYPHNDPFSITVSCHDNIRHEPSFEQYHNWLSELHKIAPHMYPPSGSTFFEHINCLNWPIPSQNPPAPLHISPQLPMLLIANKIDPATPAGNSYSLHHQVLGSRLLVTDAIGPTALLHSHCGRVAIVNYLLLAELPEHDEQCSG